MICDPCCAHIHRTISMLEGKTVNCLCYGCAGGKCDTKLRERFDGFYHQWITKKREELNKAGL